MRPIRFFAILALLVASCGTVEHGRPRPEPSKLATGPIVAELDLGEARFRLHDEGAGCVAVEILYPGLQTTVERRCFRGEQVVTETSSCGWLDPQEEAARQFDCDIALPAALYGQVTAPEISFVCLGTLAEMVDVENTVTGARFIDVSSEGFVLESARPGESDAAHLFTTGGLRYGEPPLDFPSGPIYRLCESEAPWGETELSHRIEVWITLDEALQTDELAFGLAGGLGGEATAGSSLGEAGPEIISLGVPSSGRELTAWVETMLAGDRVVQATYPWPDEFLQVLAGDVQCQVSRISVHFAEGVRSGDADAVSVLWDGTDCAAD